MTGQLRLFFQPLCSGLLLLGAACGSNSAHEHQESLRPTEVSVVAVQRGDIGTVIQATGTISPDKETFIGPRVSGRIEKLFVDEGEFVEKGSPLVSLEQVRFSLALNEAEASSREAAAQLRNAELKLNRNQELFDRGIINKEAFDNIATEYELARARAAISASRLDKAREDMKDSVLQAPFSGFVVKRRMNAGEIYSGMANDYVFHLVDTSRVKVEVNIFETKKRYVEVGKKVAIHVDALPGSAFEGEITVVNPLVDPASRKFLVKIEVPNKNYQLEPGMFARVQIPEVSQNDVLLVPAGAVVEREGEMLVFAAEGSTASERPITTGLVTHNLVEVTSGIREGDQVITDGLYAVKNGTAIVVKK